MLQLGLVANSQIAQRRLQFTEYLQLAVYCPRHNTLNTLTIQALQCCEINRKDEYYYLKKSLYIRNNLYIRNILTSLLLSDIIYRGKKWPTDRDQ